MTVLLKIVACLMMATAVVVAITEAAKYLENKPEALNPCHLSDTDNFNKCFVKNLQVLFQEWKDGNFEVVAKEDILSALTEESFLKRVWCVFAGIPGFKAFGTLDPLHVKRVVIAQDPKNPVAFNADLRNVVVTGASKVKVKEARFNAKSLNLQVKLFVPKLRFDCDYKLNGRILNLALKGNGRGVFEIENFSMLLKFQLKLRDNFGYTFTDIEKLNLEVLDIGGFHVHFENLFNGQKALEDSTNAIFNENWRDFFEILQPAISRAVEAIMYDRLSKAFAHVPANYFIEDISSAAHRSR